LDFLAAVKDRFMIVSGPVNDYTKFKELYALLVHKQDAVIAFTTESSINVNFISVVFDGHPALRLSLTIQNSSLLISTLLNDFPEAIFCPSGIGNGV